MSILTILTEGSASTGSSGLATYGPILAAVASLAAVLVSAAGRKDKQKADSAAVQDAQNNTAIKGLTEAYDRINAERKEESDRADRAEGLYREREAAIRHLESENDLLRQKLDAAEALLEKTVRKRAPAKKAVKKAAAKKVTRRTR